MIFPVSISKILQNKNILWGIFGIFFIGILIFFYEPWKKSPQPSATPIPITATGTTGYNRELGIIPTPNYDSMMGKLLEQLPYRGDGFRIVFDYGENRFAVSSFPIGNPEYKQDFLTWYQSSEYNAIPLKWFIFGI